MSDRHPTRRRTTRRWTTRVGVLVASVTAATTGLALVPATAGATPWPGHPDRTIVRHEVRPGDSASRLAVRYHAWTAELVRLNALGTTAAIHRGQVLRIPVVVSAFRRARGLPPLGTRSPHRTHQPTHQQKARAPRHHRPRHHQPVLIHSSTPPRGWTHADLSRTQVRRLVARMARHYGVPPKLALAVAWQESGWQQRRVSTAGALGVMQVMPDTGRWMRWYAGRPLRLRDTHDNIRAGVLTLRVLRSWTRKDDNAIAAYYQGLGAIREHGYFRDTRQYVLSVRAHELSLVRTGSPV